MPLSGPSLELPAHRVQILGDMNQARHRGHELGRHAAEVVVVRMQPRSRILLAATDQGVEAAIDAQEQSGDLAFLARRLDRPTGGQTRHRGLAHAEDPRGLALAEIERPVGADERLGQDGAAG